MKSGFFSLVFLAVLSIGCSSVIVVPHYLADDYKDHENAEVATAPLLLQYKFLNPVEEHEVFILSDDKKRIFIHVDQTSEASHGYVVNLPVNKSYALASIFIYQNKEKHELVLGKELPLFKVIPGKLTRIRGFDIINDADPKSKAVSLAPWDSMTDNLIVVQSAKKFNVPEKAIRTVDVFKK